MLNDLMQINLYEIIRWFNYIENYKIKINIFFTQ